MIDPVYVYTATRDSMDSDSEFHVPVTEVREA